MKYTIVQFRKDYPHDAACLEKLFKLRFGKLEACPNCGVIKPEFRKLTTRRAYQCRDCYHQIYPTAGTIFEKTTTPLNYWFYAMYMMTVTRNGVAAKELERTLDITYQTAWRMARLIRTAMGKQTHYNKLKGTVEMDETYIGGADKYKGRSLVHKLPVFAMIERRGNGKAQHVINSKKKTLFPIIQENVDMSAKVMTDEYKTYMTLEKLGYDHKTIMHKLKKYVNGEISTNTVEGFFSQLKRTIKGTHIHISEKYIQFYVDECSFRYNNRFEPEQMFNQILASIVA
jgi:transposase